MTNNSDFDFKIGRGHYRGRGPCALIALAIVLLSRAAWAGGGGVAAYAFLPWLLNVVRTYAGQ
jgi:hypothetical protein